MAVRLGLMIALSGIACVNEAAMASFMYETYDSYG